MIARSAAALESAAASRKEKELTRLLIVTAGACLLGAGLIAAPATGGTSATVYAPKDCTKPKIEPKRITLTCADVGVQLKKLGWDEWNTAKVKGQGKLLVNDCDPNCASGGTDKYKVKVTLLNINNYTCGGRRLAMYRRAHLRFPDEKPPNKDDLKSFQLNCDS
jgi:hypothetical protein